MSGRPSSGAGGGGLMFKKKKDINESNNEPVNIPVTMRGVIKNKSKLEIDPDVVKKLCLICQEQWPSGRVEQLNCGHVFCYECLHHYLNYRLTVQMELVCPCCSKPMGSDCDWWDRCNEHFSQQLKSLQENIQKSKIPQLKNPSQKDIRSKFRLCRIDRCLGYVDLTASKFECSVCKKQFCFKCNLPKHDTIDCKEIYKILSQDRLDWKRCPECDVFRKISNKCNHFSCESSQETCLVCLSGWSDKYYHQCQKEYNPLPRDIWLRESIMKSSRFFNILRGVLMAILFPVFFVFILAVILMCHVVVMAITLVVAPFIVLYQGCVEDEKLITIAFFLCLPCGEIFAASMATIEVWKNFTSDLPELIITYLLTTKSLLYYILPYRQNHRYYTMFSISSSCQRIIYLIIMVILLPLLLLLVPLFFLVSTLVVFVFTLLSLPVIASKQKGIPIWVSTIFFPIVFFHFISIDYAKFFKSLLGEICSFYKIYCVTMCNYMTCQDQPEEDNACIQRLPADR